MASVRYEWITLGRAEGTKVPGISTAGIADNVIADIVGTSGNVAVTTSATADASRPTAPASTDRLYARLTAIDGPVHVLKGVSPTASLTNGLRLVVGVPEVLAIKPGEKLSFIGEA